MTYRTRLDGLRSRISHYLCVNCNTLFTKRKPERCTLCDCRSFTYFPSRKEYERFKQLSLMLKIGMITNLRIHPRFSITLAGVRTTIELDFSYDDKTTGETVYEDVKSRGSDTGISKLKRLLVEHFHGIKVTLV